MHIPLLAFLNRGSDARAVAVTGDEANEHHTFVTLLPFHRSQLKHEVRIIDSRKPFPTLRRHGRDCRGDHERGWSP
jgi:hypothetical protein